jgi:hypothetical protein
MTLLTAVLVLEGVQLLWLAILTGSLIAGRHRHDRLSRRVGALNTAVLKAQRTRHPRTGQGMTAPHTATPGPLFTQPPPPLPWETSSMPTAPPTPPPVDHPTAATPPLPYGRHAHRNRP